MLPITARDFTGKAGTNLGPLTTQWSMPASCSVYVPPCSTCGQGFAGQHCVDSGGGQAQDTAGCWPPRVSGVQDAQWPMLGWGFYSPGIACPTGYTAACTAVYGKVAGWQIEFNLRAGETAVGCCPESVFLFLFFFCLSGCL